jgi:ubiquinone/menaquinone biosynthesis C-methylase UbiE
MGAERAAADVVDWSPGGLGVRAPDRPGLEPGARLEVRPLDGAAPRRPLHGRVRSRRPSGEPDGWIRLGLELSADPWPEPIPVESRKRILGESSGQPVVAMGGSAQPVGSPSLQPRVVRYANEQGEAVCGIVDVFGEAHGAPAVVIPSAWGRTKETLLPLALTIGATFQAVGESVVVVRFDGIRRRGESYVDPMCRTPGDENLRFTFSQGVRDIHATLDFLERSTEFEPRSSILVTFSVASIEGRRALSSDAKGRLGGWVSVVGSADAQSLTRVISGGIDFFGGYERGIRFGRQEIQGLLVDMDHAGEDAIAERLAFLHDARHDFAVTKAPITWLHGRHDAWMDLARIQDALSFGERSNRRLIEIPTGHQLRTSQEALETFQLIACESARMLTGREIPPALPDLSLLKNRREHEMQRLEEAETDLRSFWKDYVVGRDGGVGMELVTHADPYERLMELQIDSLSLEPGDLILDLGSGVGPFPMQLVAREGLHELRVLEADFVQEALLRTRERFDALDVSSSRLQLRLARFDLDALGRTRSLPLRDESVDAVLLSLVLNYVSEPTILLCEIFRVLRPGGRLVLSSLKRDADISTICVDTIAALQRGRGREALGAEGERRMAGSLQRFINDAARLLDFEERGLFQFWSAPELGEMLGAAGFRDVTIESAFGDPPQALVARAMRR